MNKKYKVSDIAKDFGESSKDVLTRLEKLDDKPRKSTTVLEPNEVNFIFESMTSENQLGNLNEYFAMSEKKTEVKKVVPQKTDTKAAPEKKAEPKSVPVVAEVHRKAPIRKAPLKRKSEPTQVIKIVPKLSNGASAQKSGENVTRIDTRTQQTDDGRKYDEKYDVMAQTTAPTALRRNQFAGNKQKFRKRPRRMMRGRRESEAEKLQRIAAERKSKAMIIEVGETISVGDLALRLKVAAAELIKKLMVMGVMASISDEIEFDTAYLVAEEFHIKVEKEVVVTIEERIIDDSEDDEENLDSRDPIIVVMGHVDHGKTSILDAIRRTNVTTGEAGGITQHIGAYRAKVKDRYITFLDTPGHAAFTSMRARGAQVTDIAILVVASDDGIMPQTIEAINHAKAAEIPLIVAINKMDKHEANPEKIMQQLTEHGLVAEDWGGDIICVPVSAHTGLGIEKLLEMVLLQSEMMELRANSNRAAKGTVIEAELDKGRGPVATILIQNGTLRTGDVVVAGMAVGRVRAMTDENGVSIEEAGPSVPVVIMGLGEVPIAGDEFNAVKDEKLARELVEQRKTFAKEEKFSQYQKVTLENLFDQLSEGEMKDLNIIIKADVQGSVEALRQSLEKITSEEVRINVLHGGVGAITESDVTLANVSNAIVVGFNVRPEQLALDAATRDEVDLRIYRVIYECIEEIEAAMKGMLTPKTREILHGRIDVRQVYKVSNVGTVAGCYVTDGKVLRGDLIRVVRDGVIISEDKIDSLRRFKDDVKEVLHGYECGIGLVNFNDIHEGDVFESFIIEEYRD